MTILEPKYPICDSIQEMLSEDRLGQVLGQRITKVTCRPFETSNGFSNNLLFHVEADGHKLVMKRLRPSIDWVAQMTRDHHCRSIRLWQYGLLDRLLPYMRHEILAACCEGEEFAILMRDISHGLLNWKPIDPDQVRLMLDALARMHALFWEDETLRDDALGLSNIHNKLSLNPELNEEYFKHSPQILDILRKGRTALLDLVDSDVNAALQSIMDNPLPIEKFISRLPKTLTHSDFRQDNLAYISDSQELVVYDWQQAGYSLAVDDLCWFVGSLADHLDRHHDYYSYYQQRLSGYLGDRFDPASWQPMLEVGCLVEVITKGIFHAYFAVYTDNQPFKADMHRSVNSYNQIVRNALKWI